MARKKKDQVQEVNSNTNQIEEEELTMTTINKEELVMERANKVTVQAIGEGFMARFFRTHKLVKEIASEDTGYAAMAGLNKTAQRELFRVWVCGHAGEYGVDFDPADRRNEDNQVPAKYTNDTLLGDTAVKMVQADVEEWVAKIGNDLKVQDISWDEITEVTKSAKGKDVSPKYGNGNWAWATVHVIVTIHHTAGDTTTEGYVSMDLSLVSGQLKKPTAIGDGGYNYTSFRAEVGKDIPDAIKTEDKEEEEVKEDSAQ